MADLEAELRGGLDALGLAPTDAQVAALLDYIALLAKWNRAYTLTVVRDPRQMIGHHLLDSLAVLSRVRQQGEALSLIDVGTGAGLPGVPLALCLPDWRFELLDTNGKKCRFVQQAAGQLGLANLTVVQSRVEAYRPEPPFDLVISRAFASLADMIDGCRHLLKPGGAFLAMKGRYPHQELAELPDDVELVESWSLQVPGLAEKERHLLKLAPKG